jgi:hypothetical protein
MGIVFILFAHGRLSFYKMNKFPVFFDKNANEKVEYHPLFQEV